MSQLENLNCQIEDKKLLIEKELLRLRDSITYQITLLNENKNLDYGLIVSPNHSHKINMLSKELEFLINLKNDLIK